MRANKLVVLVLALLAFAAGAAGCMGDESDVDDYEASVVETRDRVDAAFATIGEAQSRTDFVDRMDEAGVTIGRAADDLGEEDPPEEFEDETDELETALHQLAADLQGTAAQLRQTPELFNTEGLSFEGFTSANRVLQALGEQGIAVEPLERH